MFGIRLPQNFRSPIGRRAISEFWRRWHITLSASCATISTSRSAATGGAGRGGWANLHDHHAAGRPVAWRGVAVPALGRAARAVPGDLRPLGESGLAAAQTSGLGADAALRAAGLGAVPRAGMGGSDGFLRRTVRRAQIALPAFYAALVPALAKHVQIVPVLPWLGDAPHGQPGAGRPAAGPRLGRSAGRARPRPAPGRAAGWGRSAALVAGFGFCVQALFFAPAAVPFLYFQF